MDLLIEQGAAQCESSRSRFHSESFSTVVPALESFSLQLKELFIGISFQIWSYMISNSFKNGYVILRKSQQNKGLL